MTPDKEVRMNALARFSNLRKPFHLDDSFSENSLGSMECIHRSATPRRTLFSSEDEATPTKMMLSMCDDDISNDSGIFSEDEVSPSRVLDFSGIPTLNNSYHTSPQCTTTPILSRRRSTNKSNTLNYLNDSKTRGNISLENSHESVKLALDTDSSDMTADFSESCSLPTTSSKHSDLKCITPNTMANVLRGEYSDTVAKYHVIDCRYPYEYNGGHIQNATNIWNNELLLQDFMKSHQYRQNKSTTKRHIFIFHCEFSSERGPKMSRCLRNMDRESNKACYPSLYYPEIYLLEGGYKAFYEQFPELCTLKAYTPMLHPEYVNELKYYRSQTKSIRSKLRRRSLEL